MDAVTCIYNIRRRLMQVIVSNVSRILQSDIDDSTRFSWGDWLRKTEELWAGYPHGLQLSNSGTLPFDTRP
jgi:hypothetical protein